MRSVSTTLRNLVATGSYEIHLDVLIERVQGGVSVLQSYRNFGGVNWIVSASFTVGVDQNIGTGTVSLARSSGNLSLSTLMAGSTLNMDGVTYAPALDVGREIEMRVAITEKGFSPNASYDPGILTYGPGNWIPLCQGVTDYVGLASNPIQIRFRDRSGPLADTFIMDAVEYGSDVGTPVETVFQQIADTEIPGQYIIETYPASPGFNIRRGKVQPQTMWDAYTAFAQQFGWRFEQKWKASAAEFRLTLIEPDRTITTPHYSIGPSQYINVHELDIDIGPLRTIMRGKAVDKDTGEQITYQYPAPEDVATDPQVMKYGQRRMQLAESKGGAIDTMAELEDWVDAAYADLSVPPIPHEVECFLVPWIETGDYIQFLANGVHYDQDQYGAVHTVTHEFPGPGRGRTKIRTTGKPKGAYAAWKLASVQLAGFNAVEVTDPGLYNLEDFGEITGARTQTTVTIGATCGPAVAQVHIYAATLSVPIVTEPRTVLLQSTPTILQVTGGDSITHTITIPPRNYKTYLLFVPYGADWTPGLPEYFVQEAVADLPTIRLVSQVQGSSVDTADVTLEMIDPQNRGGALHVWTNKSGTTAPDPGNSAPTTVAVAATPYTATPALTFSDGTKPLDDVVLHAGRGKRIFVRFINDQGVDTGVVPLQLLSQTTTVGPGNGTVLVTAGIIQNAASNPTVALRIDPSTTMPPTVTSYLDISGNPAVFSGDLAAAGGTFTGALSAASGTFAGSLSAVTGTFAGDVEIIRESANGIVFKDGGNVVAEISAINSGGTSILSTDLTGGDAFYWYRDSSPFVSVQMEVSVGASTHLYTYGEGGMTIQADGTLSLIASGGLVNFGYPSDATARTSTGTYLPIQVDGVTRYVLLFS